MNEHIDAAVVQAGMVAAKRAKAVANRCPLVLGIANAKDGRKCRLVLNWDSMNNVFKSTVEVSTGMDAMDDERWEKSNDPNLLQEFLDATSLYSLYSNVVPAPANALIERANTLVEYLADLMGDDVDSPIKDEKVTKQLLVLLTNYRGAFLAMREFLSQQIIQ